MDKLASQLEDNGMIEDDNGPWGSQVVLAGKPGQVGVPWDQYVWWFCISYQRLNQITCTFEYPIPHCNDAVGEIPPWALYFLSMDLDAGYWQVELERQSRSKTAFFTLRGKKRWTVMPMGFLNSHAIFVAMMAVMGKQWDEQAVRQGIRFAGSKVIVDDILAFAKTVEALLRYWCCMLEVLQFYRATVNLRKCQFLDPTSMEFVGVDTRPDGNAPARSKSEAFRKLGRPQTWSDLRMLVGTFGFYQHWLYNYELRIQPFRRLQRKEPRPGSLSFPEERKLFAAAWQEDAAVYNALLEELREDILSEPVLARPDPDRRFYLKTDWSKDGMGAVLLQAEDTPEACKAEDEEARGEPCSFDKTRAGLRLRPISFISRKTTKSEASMHS